MGPSQCSLDCLVLPADPLAIGGCQPLRGQPATEALGVRRTFAQEVATSHPDFDDTPLWDEDGNGETDDDGLVFNCHWVVLVPDERVPGGLAVRPVVDAKPDAVVPPTNPGMPIHLDSPGFAVVLQAGTLRIPVPVRRIRDLTEFRYDAVTAYLEVNFKDAGRPTLGVYSVYDVLSGDLSLPLSFSRPK